MICVGRFIGDAETREAEVALTVHDDFQGRGIGPLLLKLLIKTARENGFAALNAHVLRHNRAMPRLFQKWAPDVESRMSSDVCRFRFVLAAGRGRPVRRPTIRSLQKQHEVPP
jgi:acetyltransferase